MRRFRSARAYLFLLPFLVFFVLVTAYPVAYGGYLSLFGQHGARMWFVGLANYASVVKDPLFWSGFWIPAFLLIIQVPLMIVLAILIALLYERVPHSAAYRLIFYLPYALPGIVAGHPVVLHVLQVHVALHPDCQAARGGQTGVHHQFEPAADPPDRDPLGVDGIHVPGGLLDAVVPSQGVRRGRADGRRHLAQGGLLYQGPAAAEHGFRPLHLQFASAPCRSSTSRGCSASS